MKIVKQIIKSLLLVVMLYPTVDHLQAQVTVGSSIKPSRAALLELKTQQESGAVASVSDSRNATSTTGGFLLPRVELVSISTLEPFIADDDSDFVNNTNSLKEKLAGLMVYNITSNGGSLYPAVYSWNGANWVTSQPNDAVSSITGQPKAFSFYESGLETANELEFKVDGLGTWTYQWYQITGNNVHVRIGKPVGEIETIYPTNAAAVAAGAKTSKFKPQAILKGTTKNANNTGFYRFYCIAESSLGAKLTSDIAEVAVGCGAKDNLGEWISFMCFNLGATKLTIADQIGHMMSPVNDMHGGHYYTAGEEQVYGDLYQWGRIGDGHEKRELAFTPGGQTPGNQVMYNVATPPTFMSGNMIGPIQAYPAWQVDPNDNTYYGKFILSDWAQNYNWAFNLPAVVIDQLWRDGRFAANDPCAKIKDDGLTYETYYPPQDGISGADTNWRMPSQHEWGSIFRGGSITGSRTTATANTWDWNPTNGRGMEIKPDGETTTLFLPANGLRNYYNGWLYYQSWHGYYWSTNIIGNNAIYLTFYGYGDDRVLPASIHARGFGFALRCIKN